MTCSPVFPTRMSLAMADIAEVEEIIHSTGFFHSKAKHIIAASRSLVERFSGTVPDTMEDLLTIPGVGRKTANIVLYHAFGKNKGVAVDTHVFRLAGRLGFSDSGNAEGIEKDLMHLFPEKDWGVLTDILISHGRAICTARKPACTTCPVSLSAGITPEYYSRETRNSRKNAASLFRCERAARYTRESGTKDRF